MARIGLAGFMHETNTFSPIPTTFESFAEESEPLSGILFKTDMLKFVDKPYNNAVCGFYQKAVALGHEVVPLVKIGEAEPSGTLPHDLFNHLLGLIIEEIALQGPFDGIFLDLHGAMVYGDFQDGETEILRQVRQLVGDIPIVNSLDMHGNVSPECFELASAMNGYRTYPHTDIYETGVRCAELMDVLLNWKPVYKSFRMLPFLMPSSRQSTNTEPCKSIFKEINVLESDPQVHSATIVTGFLPSDLPHTGPSICVYASTQAKADEGADRLYDVICEREAEFDVNLPNAADAVTQGIALAAQSERPVILADVQDNPGGGSSSDTTWVLKELVRQKAEKVAVALMYDPEAALAAHRGGEGSTITIGLGGKYIAGDTPLYATYRVEKLFDGEFTAVSPMSKGMTVSLGKMAQLRIDDVRVVVSSVRVQALEAAFFHVVGIQPEEMKILVLKSTNHYRAAFEPISSHIIVVGAPGATFDDATTIQYKNLRDGVRLKGLGPENRRVG